MTDDRFVDEWATAKEVVRPRNDSPSTKKYACKECFDGFRIYRIGNPRYAFACDCEKGRHLEMSGIPSYRSARNESERLTKEHDKLYGKK
jgi:hypothetical protein